MLLSVTFNQYLITEQIFGTSTLPFEKIVLDESGNAIRSA